MSEILVVEDYPPMAATLTRLLKSAGHRVVRELTVAGALQHKVTFDMAVLDIDLPDGNGVDLAELLLASHRATNVVFFTATRQLGLLTRAAASGRVVDKAQGTRQLLDCIAGAKQSESTSDEREPSGSSSATVHSLGEALHGSSLVLNAPG